MDTSAGTIAGTIAVSEVILLSVYRNPKAFFKGLNEERKQIFREWAATGNMDLFKTLFIDPITHYAIESFHIPIAESEYEISLKVA